mgnify:CR=1 FL=1
MDIETLKKAKTLESYINENKEMLESTKNLLPIEENEIEVRIKGTSFHLSKAIFVAEHKKIIKKMEDDIKTKEIELSNI